MTDILRTWLIAALTHQELPALAEQRVAELVDVASDQGVLVLLEHRLLSHPSLATLPDNLFSQIQQQAKLSLLQQLPFFAEQKQVYQALNRAHIPFLVMKGAALGYWLYDSPNHRPVTDIDVWFEDRQTVDALAEILRPLGFSRVASSGELTGFEQAFDKDFNGVKIRLDAHWAMFNSAVLSKGMPFGASYACSTDIDIHQQSVKILSVNDALINSIGHRALKYLSGQADTLKWLLDQHLLFEALNASQWQELVTQSAELGISDLTLDAIEQAQKHFRTRTAPNVVDMLSKNARNESIQRSWFQSWTSYQWHEMLAVSPKFTERVVWLWQRLWPNPEAMRERYGRDDPVWKFMLKRIGAGLQRLFS